MGCSFLLGRVGVHFIRQPAYLAVGAYATAFYLFYFGHNPYIGILLGILAGVVVSAIVGTFFVRLRSDYFALVNLALCGGSYSIDGESSGENYPWRQRSVVLGQHVVYSCAGSRQAQPFLRLRFPGAMALWPSTSIWMIRSMVPVAWRLRRTRQIEISRLQQFQHPLDGFYHCQCDDRLAGSLYAVYLGFVSPPSPIPLERPTRSW